MYLWRKAMANVDSMLKSIDVTLPAKVHLVKAMVFPVVMYGCESWTIKKAECQRIDAFELWCWRRLLRVPWTARRSNQSILKEISPEYSLEGLILKLKLQSFGHLMWRTDPLEKTLRMGKIESRRRRGWQRMRWLDGIPDSMDMSLQTPGVGEGQGSPAWCSPWGCKVKHDWATELDRTELNNVASAMAFFSLHLAFFFRSSLSISITLSRSPYRRVSNQAVSAQCLRMFFNEIAIFIFTLMVCCTFPPHMYTSPFLVHKARFPPASFPTEPAPVSS